MIQLTSFQEITSADFDDLILQKIITEIYSVIRENLFTFRLQIEIGANTIEERLYKHTITGFFMKAGFKTVKFNGFILIDWGSPNINISSNPAFFVPLNNINSFGSFFRAEDIYLSCTGNQDLRKVSYRPLIHKIENEIKQMVMNGNDTSTISLGISANMSADQLNNLFAPDLLKINLKYPDILLSFIDGGLFKITMYSVGEYYTDIPYEVLFGTKIY